MFFTVFNSEVDTGLNAVVGRQGPYKKYNCVKKFFYLGFDYLGIIFISVMSTKLPMISLVKIEL